MERAPPIPPLPPELGVSSSVMERSLAISGSGVEPPQLPPKPFASEVQNTKLPNTGPPAVPPPPSLGENQYIFPPNGYQQQPYTKPMPPRPQKPLEITRNVQAEYLHGTSNRPVTPVYDPQLRGDSYSPVSPLSPDPQHTETRVRSARASQPSHFQPRQPPRQALFQNPHPIPTNSRPGPHQFREHQQRIASSQHGPDPRYDAPNAFQTLQPKPKPPEDLLTSPFENPIPEPSPNIAPPPIPPNPQKDALLAALSQTLTQRVKSAHDTNMSALPPLRAQQSALHSSLTAMNREIAQLNDLQSLLTSDESILHQAMRDADKVMEDAKHRKVPNVDDVLVAPTVVARQLYELVADETSLEECRAVVGRALDRGRIGGDVWAKVGLDFPCNIRT